MARIDALPSLEIIRGLKGILDFYYWRGLPCVRAWPKYRPARQTAASLAAALVFGAILKSYSLLADTVLEAYREAAVGIPRTARDIMVSGVYGNLHEASMSDFLTLLTDCRNFLSDLTALLNALHSIDTDELVVRVEHSVLPDDAATHTRQLTMLTALQKIDDLQDALESKSLDRLLVRGTNQLWSFKEVFAITTIGAISGANGYLAQSLGAVGQVWIPTTVSAADQTTAVSQIRFTHNVLAVLHTFHQETKAFLAGEYSSWSGQTYITPVRTIRAYFQGGLGGDTCEIHVTGFKMTLET